MAVGQVIRVTLFSSFRNQVGLNVLHYRQTSSQPSYELALADLQPLVNALSNVVGPAMKECLSQESVFNGLEGRLLAALPVNDVIATAANTAGAGTAATAGTEPSQVCGLLSKRTGLGGRRNRGRMYVPFVPADAPDPDDLVGTAYFTQLQDLATVLTTPVTATNGMQTTTITQCLAGLVRNAGGPLVTQMVVREGFATQRRRGYYGRPNSPPPL